MRRTVIADLHKIEMQGADLDTESSLVFCGSPGSRVDVDRRVDGKES
jgi:hypothetical protein